jgi:hypothetical protein
MFRRRHAKERPSWSIVGRGGPAVLDDTIAGERQQVLNEFCAYERELFSRTPTPEELAEYERRKEQVREHGRDCIRRAREQDGLPPLD